MALTVSRRASCSASSARSIAEVLLQLLHGPRTDEGTDDGGVLEGGDLGLMVRYPQLARSAEIGGP